MTCQNLVEFKATDNCGVISGSRLETLFKDMTGINNFEMANENKSVYYVMESDVGLNGHVRSSGHMTDC